MKSRYMKPLRWPARAEEAEYMRMRKGQNLRCARNNSNENWFAGKLDKSGHKWSRQATWGYRVFDFWCHELGIAIEVGGPEHNRTYDAYRDEYNLRRSGTVVLRVRNRNEVDAAKALSVIAAFETWKERREKLGLNAPSKSGRRHLVDGQQDFFDGDI